jgi:hypothetical protein
MNELYEKMKQILNRLYESGEIEMDYVTFFKLYKLVCDMMQIKAIVKQNDE